MRTRPRLDGYVSSALTVAGDAPIARLRASIQGCDTSWTASCNPVELALATPATTATIDLPLIAGDAGGRIVTVDVTIEGEDGSSAQQSASVDFWPVDSGLGIACTRSYDANGRLALSVELIDEGLPTNPSASPPRPYLLSELFDVRYYVFQRGPFGWLADESDSFRGTFFYDPVTFDVFDDGRYQIVIVGQLGFVEPIQAATLTFDTTGAGPDLCPFVP